MSKLQWFRLYHRIIDDEKIRLLAFEDRWHFIALCCLKADGLLDEPESGLKERKIAVKIGVQTRELDEIRRRLFEVGLIDENMQPVAWNELQYKSDTSTERVRNHREKSKTSALKRARNVSVTPSETEADTDTEATPSGAANAPLPEKSDLIAMTDRLVEAAGEKIQPHGALVLAPILGLVEAGCDLETDILPTIRAVSSRLKRPAGSWAYFVAPIREAFEARRAAGKGLIAGGPPPSQPAGSMMLVGNEWKPTTETRWASRLKSARESRQWSSTEWGPAPGQSGCIAPKHLLQPGDGDGWREWQNEAA